MQHLSGHHPSPPSSDPRGDLVKVTAIVNGSVDSWQRFVEEYSNLILKVLRQVLFVEDDDEVHSVYVDLLEDLYDRRLGQYRGNASLSTWLVVVSRGFAIDYLRRKNGRPRLPAGYERLDDAAKLVYRWHYVEGISLSIVLDLLNLDGNTATLEDLINAVQSIESTIDPRTLNRLGRERAALHAGHRSWRELQFVLHVRSEYSTRYENGRSAETDRLETEERQRLLQAVREKLPDQERTVVDLRFEEGLTAKEISRRVGWATPRRVYTLIQSALRRFRRELTSSHQGNYPE